jgi:hypothetical protein
MDAEHRLSTSRMPRERFHDLRSAEIELRANFGTRERAWLLGRLMSQSGVADASWSDAHAPSLLIEYDADVMTGAELVDFLYLCGLSAPARAARE